MSDWKESVFQSFKLYGVTDITDASEDILPKVDAAYEGGADIIQLRSKNLKDNELFEIGQKMAVIAEKYQKLFFVNDRVDLAIQLKADGIHVGQEDMSLSDVRKFLKQENHQAYLGKSTHSLEQALATVNETPDYIGVGPVFETPTKPNYKSVGCDLVSQVASQVEIPFVAIGGINEKNIDQVLESGATRVAVVRAIFSAEDVYESTRRIREKIECRSEQRV